MAQPLAAVTGAAGFLGGEVARTMAAQGWRLRLLVRGDLADPRLAALQPEIVRGDLADPRALQRLCRGVQAIVHVAGMVKARHASLFQVVNAEGAGRLAAVCREVAPGAVFVLVSSLAARAPQLSPYAASKRGGELAVTQALGGGAWIVRPPAIYGPGDRATLGLFRAAAVSPVLPTLRPEVAIPLIHVQDAASAIAALAGSDEGRRTIALCDGRATGYGLGEIVSQAAVAVGGRARLLAVPRAVVRAVGVAGDLAGLCGATPMVTSGKVRELLDGDWSFSGGELAPEVPAPRFGLADGFRDTVAGYRALGWL